MPESGEMGRGRWGKDLVFEFRAGDGSPATAGVRSTTVGEVGSIRATGYPGTQEWYGVVGGCCKRSLETVI